MQLPSIGQAFKFHAYQDMTHGHVNMIVQLVHAQCAILSYLILINDCWLFLQKTFQALRRRGGGGD